MELNHAQQQAVAIVDGPVLVVAGAGTGKTRVTVERILHLMESGVAPENILALTFTEKAAGEMLDRVNEARGSTTLDATIATYNGFGHMLLEQYGSEWGLGSLRLLGETGQLVFLREHLDDFELDYFAPVSRPDGQLELLRKYVSLLKQQVIMPERYKEFAKQLPAKSDDEKLEKQKHSELAAFFATYTKLSRANGLIDYDDQLYLTIELLRERPNILHDLQQRYTHILVDEFQDTNPMQSTLIDMLTGKQQNIMVVGDDDQSIYGWRGATLANILDFKQKYPKSAEITLIENYRSSQEILDAAYRLIQYNNPDRLEVINKLDKHLHGQKKGTTPSGQQFSSLDAELTWVAHDVAARLKKGQDASTIAILARRNQTIEKIHETLELYDIPHAVSGLSNDIYQEQTVRQLIEALKAVGDPLDDLALFHTLIGPLFDIEVGVLAELSAKARKEHEKLIIALQDSSEETIQAALKKLEDWRHITQDQTVGALAYEIITDSGWKEQLYAGAEHDAVIFRQVQALSKYFKTLKEFEKIADVASVHSYLNNLATLKAAGSGFEDASLDISDTLVNVLSVHRAKGLEWETVYVVDCTEGSFPMSNFGSGLTLPSQLLMNPTDADNHIAEERRLMYVATTRAKDELILTYANRHGSGAPRKPSRFLTELLGETMHTLHDEETQTALELFAPQVSQETIGLPATIQKDGKISLSVSQIDCYLRCPQDFYYLHVLQMPVAANPTLQYGTLIHGVIEKLHKGLASNKVPSLESLATFVEQNLPAAGYVSAKSRERAKKQALETVSMLYDRIQNTQQPTEIEKPFRVMLPDSPLEIIGRMDALYEQTNGIEIRDFKTGTSANTAEKAKARATSSNQLALYALAWQLQHDEMPALLTLDFVETGQLGSVKKQQKSLDTLTGKLMDMVTKLHTGVYEPGKDHLYCKHPY